MGKNLMGVAMTYAVIYAENADLIADYASRDEAEHALADICRDDPGARNRIGLMPFDDDGMPAGDFEPAEKLLREFA
jgi:predicted Zn-dependent protease